MKHTEDIISKLLHIKEATKLAERKDLCADDVQKLRDFILENRRQIPSFALSHFDRLEASGKSGIAAVQNGKCGACKADLPSDELEYLTNTNIGVCDNCYAFIYLPDPKYQSGDILKKLLQE